jgi:hypothetical protein
MKRKEMRRKIDGITEDDKHHRRTKSNVEGVVKLVYGICYNG